MAGVGAMLLEASWHRWTTSLRDRAGGPGWLAAVGVLSAGAYVFWWTRPTWIFSVSLQQRALGPTDFLGYSAGGAVSYMQGVTVPFLLYLLALGAAVGARSRLTVAVAIAGAVGLPLTLLLAYPSLAADVFDYLMLARIWIVHGENPYVMPPGAFPGDPYLPAVGWPGLRSVYGPAFLAMTGLPVRLAGDDPTTALIIYKVMVIAAHGGTAWFVYLIVRHLAPPRALFALVAYGWNPLAVLYFGVDGHNDAVMLLFLAAAIYAAIQEHHELSLPLLAFSALIKFVPLILFPVFLLAAWRQPRRLAVGLFISLILAVAFFWPFWAGADTIEGLRDQGSRFTSSPASLLQFVIADETARLLMFACFALGYVAALLMVKGLIHRSLTILALYLVTVSFWLKGWYLTWPLMLGALAGGWPLALAALWSVGPLLLNLFNAWGWQLNWWHWQERWGMWMMELWLMSSLLAPLAAGLLIFVAASVITGRIRNPFVRKQASS